MCARVVSLMCYQDVQQNPDFYRPNFTIKNKNDAKYYLYVYIQDPIWLCYRFTLSANSQEISKAWVLHNLVHCFLVGHSKRIHHVQMCNSDFQGSMKLKKKKSSPIIVVWISLTFPLFYYAKGINYYKFQICTLTLT